MATPSNIQLQKGAITPAQSEQTGTKSAVSLIAMVVVSLMTQEPDKATQKMVDDVRVPSGRTVIGKQ